MIIYNADRMANGTFAHGNQCCASRRRYGRKSKFSDGTEVLETAIGYFDFIDQNPLYDKKAFFQNGNIAFVRIPGLRTMTICGLCLHIGVYNRQWNAWKKRGDRYHLPVLLPVIERIEQLIWCQKFEGAAAGLFNARIISRELWTNRS
jgi:hypothetical protein